MCALSAIVVMIYWCTMCVFVSEMPVLCMEGLEFSGFFCLALAGM